MDQAIYAKQKNSGIGRGHQATRKEILTSPSVPQGGVLSRNLFILFINDIVKDFPMKVKAALYVDDLVLWCTEEELVTATFRIQLALYHVNQWTEQWCVTINKDKSSTTLFTLSPKKDHRPHTLDGTKLRKEEQLTYLGVTYDKRLEPENWTISTYINTKMFVCLFVCYRFLGHFETDWETLWLWHKATFWLFASCETTRLPCESSCVQISTEPQWSKPVSL